MPFKTTGEYVAFCSDATLANDCYGGYEAALVQLMVSKSIGAMRRKWQMQEMQGRLIYFQDFAMTRIKAVTILHRMSPLL